MAYLGEINEKLVKELKKKKVNVSNEELYDIYENTSYKYKHYKMLSITEEIIVQMKKELKIMESEMKNRNLKKPSFITVYERKKLQAKWYLQLKAEIIEHLNELEERLEELNKSIEHENINKNYDNISSKIDTIMIEISFIEKVWGMYSYERILKKVRNLKNIIANLLKKIDASGSTSRKEIFFRLEELKDSVNEDEIRELLRWIWNKLNLGVIEYQKIYSLNEKFEHKQGVKINSNVYESQIEDFNLCLHYSIFNNIFDAILSLNNFIAPYSYILEEPFNLFERLCIRTMIENIVKNMDKNSGRYCTQYESVFE